jgi:hypothetical protein
MALQGRPMVAVQARIPGVGAVAQPCSMPSLAAVGDEAMSVLNPRLRPVIRHSGVIVGVMVARHHGVLPAADPSVAKDVAAPHRPPVAPRPLEPWKVRWCGPCQRYEYDVGPHRGWVPLRGKVDPQIITYMEQHSTRQGVYL